MKLQALESGIWHGSFEDAAGNLRVISLRTGDRATAETIAAALVELSASVTVTVTPSVVPKTGWKRKYPRSERQRSIFIVRL